MTFEDRISSQGRLPDLAPLRRQYALLCAQLLAAITHHNVALTLACQLQQHVRKMIQTSEAHFRSRQKMAMLLRPSWREKVIADLGGWKRLKRWAMRQAEIESAPPETAYETVFHPAEGPEEMARRARMRELMRPNVHPGILRDPYRIDFDGWFRLPPQLRLTNPIADADYEYDFDPRPMANFIGIRTPITVWPDEFKAAAEVRPLGVDDRVADVSREFTEEPLTEEGEVGRSQFFCGHAAEVPSKAREPVFSEKPILFFHVRAPPRIRGSPNITLRQARLGGALSRTHKKPALNKHG